MIGAMLPIAFALFPTPIGACAIAWSERGVAGLQLPERNESLTKVRLLRRFPDATEAPPSAEVQTAIDAIAALLSGERRDLSDITIDMGGVPAFERRVYEVARTIPAGETLTYGEIAKRLGEPNAAREVGAALGRNPVAIIVPCHRVLGADGKIGGFSANGGVETKLRILSIEKARTSSAPSLFDELPLAVKPREPRGR
jgi:methylated-DNA-[protein]-cysteine S-methyltransferase